MLSSKLLKGGKLGKGPAVLVDRFFVYLSALYKRTLAKVIHYPWMAMVVVLVISAATVFEVQRLPSEYAPAEDRGAFFISLRAPEGATLEYTDLV